MLSEATSEQGFASPPPAPFDQIRNCAVTYGINGAVVNMLFSSGSSSDDDGTDSNCWPGADTEQPLTDASIASNALRARKVDEQCVMGCTEAAYCTASRAAHRQRGTVWRPSTQPLTQVRTHFYCNLGGLSIYRAATKKCRQLHHRLSTTTIQARTLTREEQIYACLLFRSTCINFFLSRA